MIYAIDSNVILDVLLADPNFGLKSMKLLSSLYGKGDFISCDIVWAEASAAIGDKDAFAARMADLGIGFSPMSKAASLRAGQVWRMARSSQKQQTNTARKQIIPDFLIGAHALENADALITRDRGFLRGYFSSLKIIDPSNS